MIVYQVNDVNMFLFQACFLGYELTMKFLNWVEAHLSVSLWIRIILDDNHKEDSIILYCIEIICTFLTNF